MPAYAEHKHVQVLHDGEHRGQALHAVCVAIGKVGQWEDAQGSCASKCLHKWPGLGATQPGRLDRQPSVTQRPEGQCPTGQDPLLVLNSWGCYLRTAGHNARSCSAASHGAPSKRARLLHPGTEVLGLHTIVPQHYPAWPFVALCTLP